MNYREISLSSTAAADFESPRSSGFNILSATPNTQVDITAGRINTIGSDVTIKSFAQYGSLDVNGTSTITGGTVIMAGTSSMATNFTNASQGAMLINTVARTAFGFKEDLIPEAGVFAVERRPQEQSVV